ncbi:MAG: hypothetical protein LBD59_03950 [Prevotellaceae bacterium]|jgi:hypothetical protein|nr:hypothetical protein [Prevotellaceae bacterium]
MGRGIAGIIPVTFCTDEKSWSWNVERFLKNTDKDVFEFYSEIANDDPQYRRYQVRGEVVLRNLKSFISDFYTLIDGEIPEEAAEIFNSKYDEIVEQNNFSALLAHIGELSFPKYYTQMSWVAFSSSAQMRCIDYILFYFGSYKTLMEEYSTLLHMKKLLVKAIDNPLSQITQFGLFG